MRAVSGAGKSTFINNYIKNNKDKVIKVVSADHYFIENGKYNFDFSKLHQAHMQCQNNFEKYIKDDKVNIIFVDNTNLVYREMKYYIDMSIENNFNWNIIQINIPQEIILKRQTNCKNISKDIIDKMFNKLINCALSKEIQDKIIIVNGEKEYENF